MFFDSLLVVTGILRLARIFRVIKVGTFKENLDLVVEALRRSKSGLVSTSHPLVLMLSRAFPRDSYACGVSILFEILLVVTAPAGVSRPDLHGDHVIDPLYGRGGRPEHILLRHPFNLL